MFRAENSEMQRGPSMKLPRLTRPGSTQGIDDIKEPLSESDDDSVVEVDAVFWDDLQVSAAHGARNAANRERTKLGQSALDSRGNRSDVGKYLDIVGENWRNM
jgi:hypothetical protein